MAGELQYLRAEIELLAQDADNAISQAKTVKEPKLYWAGIEMQATVQKRYVNDLLFIVDAMIELGIGEPPITVMIL